MASCIGSFLKGFLTAVNILILGLGLAIVGLGAAALGGVVPLLRDWNLYVLIALIVGGGLSAILAGARLQLTR
jgi:hypothetical protein